MTTRQGPVTDAVEHVGGLFCSVNSLCEVLRRWQSEERMTPSKQREYIRALELAGVSTIDAMFAVEDAIAARQRNTPPPREGNWNPWPGVEGNKRRRERIARANASPWYEFCL